MPNRDPQDLERFVHRALGELPTHRAPASLENRVLAALAARHRAPWWQRGWQAWPLVPRTAVLGASVAVLVGCAWLALTGQQALAGLTIGGLVQDHAPWIQAIGSIAGTFAKAGSTLFFRYQPWFVAALSVLGVAHLVTVGLGATVYRSLLLNR